MEPPPDYPMDTSVLGKKPYSSTTHVDGRNWQPHDENVTTKSQTELEKMKEEVNKLKEENNTLRTR